MQEAVRTEPCFTTTQTLTFVRIGSLLLMDLGANTADDCADITRTYPVNGTYTERQRQVYDIVLAANREVAKTAKPGMTLKELNEIAKKSACSRLHETRSDRKRGRD